MTHANERKGRTMNNARTYYTETMNAANDRIADYSELVAIVASSAYYQTLNGDVDAAMVSVERHVEYVGQVNRYRLERRKAEVELLNMDIEFLMMMEG